MLAADVYLKNVQKQALVLIVVSSLLLCFLGANQAVSFLAGFLSVLVAHLVFFSIAFRGSKLPFMGGAVVRMIVATGAKVLTVALLAYWVLQSTTLAGLIGQVNAGFFIVGFIACVLVGTVLNARAMAKVSD